MSITADDFIGARWYYQGRARPVRLGILHATQSPEQTGAARAVANYFANLPSTNKASAHVVVDNAETIECVAPGNTAFAVPNANADGYSIEQVGYSEQDEIDWSDPYSVKVIERAANVAREASAMFGLPLQWLDEDHVAAGVLGWTDHATCSRALGGSHWDPGPAYPRDHFMDLLVGAPEPPAPTPWEPDMAVTLAKRANKDEVYLCGIGIEARHVESFGAASQLVTSLGYEWATIPGGGTPITDGDGNTMNVWVQNDPRGADLLGLPG